MCVSEEGENVWNVCVSAREENGMRGAENDEREGELKRVTKRWRERE